MAKNKRVLPNMRTEKRTEAPQAKICKSLLDEMIDGNEYGSIVQCAPEVMDLAAELRRAIKEISLIRNRPVVCYLANVVNTNIRSSIGIDITDDLPFSEMLHNVNSEAQEIDIILVTPGGSAEQVAKFVNRLRPRFENVAFILPYMAMSAGTIFCLSGDELIMDSRAYIGPIDPQVLSRGGNYVPAQSILTLIADIQERGQDLINQGQQPPWTDIQILNNLDAKEIGNAISASRFSIQLVRDYLSNYKFKTWTKHSSSGLPVTDADRTTRAEEIAAQLCNHSIWKTHSMGISREMARSQCRLQITSPEDIAGLQKAIRRFWALSYWVFERTNIVKILISDSYALFRSENHGNQ